MIGIPPCGARWAGDMAERHKILLIAKREVQFVKNMKWEMGRWEDGTKRDT